MLVAEAVAAGCHVEGQFVARASTPVDGAGPVHRLGRGVAERVSDTQTPTGLLAIVDIPPVADDVLADAELVVVADGVADPGNLGTILRSAEAAGFDVVVTHAGHRRPVQPEDRAGVGRLGLPRPGRGGDARRRAGGRPAAARHVVAPGTAHTDVDWSRALSPSWPAARRTVSPPDAPVDEWVRIEHHGRAESINVAMAVDGAVLRGGASPPMSPVDCVLQPMSRATG